MNKFKSVTQRERDLITGYFRQIQTMIGSENPYYNAPELLVYLTILFHYVFEYFTKCGSAIKFDDDKYTITTMKHGEHKDWSSAYGNIIIDGSLDCRYKWEFDIIATGPDKQYKYGITTIGIDSSNKKFAESYLVKYSNT